MQSGNDLSKHLEAPTCALEGTPCSLLPASLEGFICTEKSHCLPYKIFSPVKYYIPDYKAICGSLFVFMGQEAKRPDCPVHYQLLAWQRKATGNARLSGLPEVPEMKAGWSRPSSLGPRLHTPEGRTPGAASQQLSGLRRREAGGTLSPHLLTLLGIQPPQRIPPA